jgi:hypothetical protein
VYLPVFAYYMWLAVRLRSLAFFAAVNPGIRHGGMAGEAKAEILPLLPSHLLPSTVVVQAGATAQQVLARMQAQGIGFPVIAKPNVGERGRLVEKIDDATALARYLAQVNETVLVQQYVDLPVEAGILYYRLPTQTRGHVTSIVLKELLAVVGDGTHTVGELILQQPRARMVLHRLQQDFKDRWNDVLPAGARLLLVPIGNHIRGTCFRNGNAHITPAMAAAYDAIFAAIPGVYFGRLDVRAASMADLQAGRIIILELNGVSSEPGHIYDPDFPLLRAWGVLLHHWRIIAQIAQANHRAGVPYLSFAEGRRMLRDYFAAHRHRDVKP